MSAARNVQPEIGIGIDNEGLSVLDLAREILAADRGFNDVFVLICVVAQARRLVELEHIDAAKPGAVAHPEVAVFVIRHGGIDGIDPVDKIICGIPVCRILFGNAFFPRHLFIICRGSGGLIHPRIDHFAHIRPGAVQVVGDQQNDDGALRISVHREVHTPLAHRLVPDDVGRPAVALQRLCIGVVPRMRTYAFGNDLHQIFCVRQIAFKRRPVDKVVRLRLRDLRPEDVIDLLRLITPPRCLCCLRRGIRLSVSALVGDHDGRIVHGDRTVPDVLRGRSLGFRRRRTQQPRAEPDARQKHRAQRGNDSRPDSFCHNFPLF